jgi:hypothetical protein
VRVVTIGVSGALIGVNGALIGVSGALTGAKDSTSHVTTAMCEIGPPQ